MPIIGTVPCKAASAFQPEWRQDRQMRDSANKGIAGTRYRAGTVEEGPASQPLEGFSRFQAAEAGFP